MPLGGAASRHGYVHELGSFAWPAWLTQCWSLFSPDSSAWPAPRILRLGLMA
jgi:hypothetical protein